MSHALFFQNIHLVRSWLPRLEKKLDSYSHSANENYRVFMSAKPASKAEGHILPQVSFILYLILCKIINYFISLYFKN